MFKNCLIKFLQIIGPRNHIIGGFLTCLIALVIGLLVGTLTQWWAMAAVIGLLTLAVLMIAAIWVHEENQQI